jgi:hypothetical protein
LPDQWDFQLRPTDAPDAPMPPKRSLGKTTLRIAVGGLILAAGVATYIVFGPGAPDPAENTAAAPPAVQETEETVRPLGAAAESIVVPPLDESDPLVRNLVGRLSAHPSVAAWLATEGLIRNFTVVVVNIADGNTPATHLRVLRPSGSFRTVEQNGDLYTDPRSYERYDRIADAVASIDTAGSARLYATLKPRIEEAYRGLGFPDASFDRTLERAIASLLQTPIADAPLRIEPRGIGYGFADPRLQTSTGAQKQLMRMGPRNVRIIERKLREIALELGIPPGRLPPAR